MSCGLVHASYSLPEWQALKLTFFAPWTPYLGTKYEQKCENALQIMSLAAYASETNNVQCMQKTHWHSLVEEETKEFDKFSQNQQSRTF